MLSFFRKLTRRLSYWLKQDKRQRLLDEELKFHLDSMTQDLIAEGVQPDEAFRTAHAKFGNLTRLSEEARSAWISRWATDAAQDLRYTLRNLKRDSAIALFIIPIVGLGVGASTVVFSIISAMLLRPLPFNDPDRLVWIANTDVDSEGLTGETVPVGHYLQLRDQKHSFADIAAYSPFYEPGNNKLSGTGLEPQRLTGVSVSQNFFPLLGVSPQIGRTFSAADCQFKWNQPRAVLLSDSLWKNRFASDPRVIGRVLTLNDAPITVVGIMPAAFDFASVFAPGTHIDLYLPYPLTSEADRRGNELSMLGRLKPSATLQSARAELSVLGPLIRRRDPELNFKPKLSALNAHVSERARPALLALAGAVAFVMLIVCVNLSNLLLARSTVRQKEMAVRSALGAERTRLIRQVLTESAVLSFLGALLGLALAVVGTRIVTHLNTLDLPLLDSVRVDAGVLAFTLLMAVFIGLIFGAVPALQAPSAAVQNSLKENSRGATSGSKNAHLRETLVVAEIAFAFVLLIGAGLLIRSFESVLEIKLGFQPDRATAVRIDPSSKYRSEQQRAYFNAVLDRVRNQPGIEAAGIADVLPLSGDRTWGARANGQTYSKRHPAPWAFVRVVSDGYLKAMGISLLEGRDFNAHDNASGRAVIIVNQTLAHTLWSGRSALGQVLNTDIDRQIVGVVSDVRHLALEQESGCEEYLPIDQTGDYGSLDLITRSALAPSPLNATIRDAVRAVDPSQPANEFRTLRQILDKATSVRRFTAFLLAAFSAFALVLVSLGIYGVISYSVNQRTQELGIRMALGASASRLQSRIVRRTLALAVLGAALGIVGSWGLVHVISSFLFGVTSTDPITFIATLSTLIVVAALAAYLPARRISRIDPMAALRSS